MLVVPDLTAFEHASGAMYNEHALITPPPPLPPLSSVQMTPADIKNIREIAEREDVLELLAKSLAPSIYGHDHIKKALVLQLLVSHYHLLEHEVK